MLEYTCIGDRNTKNVESFPFYVWRVFIKGKILLTCCLLRFEVGTDFCILFYFKIVIIDVVVVVVNIVKTACCSFLL